MDLKELRESAGLSAEKVAIELEKSVSTIRFWEAGTYTPNLNPIETYKLTKIYNCTLKQLADAFAETQSKRGKNASS
ncbi:MAG TPA: helix-turn-helix transcriptional regulator [Cyanophyceae cyanobacterium]